MSVRRSAARVAVLAGLGLLALCGRAGQASAQSTEAWISITEPVEWRGEVTRGIVVRRRNSIRVSGLAFQPGGVDRVEIDGRRAQLEPQPNGEVRFVGYADTDTVASRVEIAAYASGPRPPYVRQFAYEPGPPSPAPRPADAFEASGGFRGERYAVVIGISDYADPQITPLRYADDDAISFYNFLTSDAAGLGGFRPENIRLLTNEAADTRSVRTALTSFLRQVTDQDVVVIYIAGHGAADPFRPTEYYLLTHDTDAANYPGTAISMDDIDDYVRRLRARDILVFTDACHSAAVTGTNVAFRATETNAINQIFLERLQATAAGLLTFTASETNQLSQEGTRWGGGHGVFTYQLLRALEGAADEDADGIVTLGEVVEYTRLTVQRETQGAQVPFVGSGSFDRSWPMAIATTTAVAAAGAGPSTVPSFGGAAPPPPREEEAAVQLMSPAGTFMGSLLIPGSGQFRTGRGWRGGMVLLGSAGAITYGFLNTSVTRQCREATVNGVCQSGQYTSTQTTRPHLLASIVTAGALTFVGAVDALVGARKVNRDRLEAAGQSGDAFSMAVLPTSAVANGRAGDLRLLELRFR